MLHTAEAMNHWRRSLILLGLVAMLISGCTAAPDATPEATPGVEADTLPGVITLSESDPPVYRNPDLGFSFAYPDDWVLSGRGGPEGVVATILSPDGAIQVDVIRDFPPPTIDVKSYGKALMAIAKGQFPVFEVVKEDVITLGDGNQAYVTRFAVEDQGLKAGDMLLVIRTLGEIQDALIVQATGAAGSYIANTRNIQTIMTSFSVDADTPSPAP